MEERKGGFKSVVTRIFNPRTQGAVTAETTLVGRLQESARIRQDIEDELHPGRGLEASRADVYGSGSTVSIEGAAETQLNLQEKLDQRVVDENKGVSHHDTQGLQPCQRVRRGES